jgi:hypothetical protein
MSPDSFLFPGFRPGGRDDGARQWDKPVTRRGYLDRLKSMCAPALEAERAAALRRGVSHPFQGYDLAKLGTHSMKRTAVTTLKDGLVSSAVVAAICGTTAKTLDRTYDEPTARRQKRAVEECFDPFAKVAREVSAQMPSAPAE